MYIVVRISIITSDSLIDILTDVLKQEMNIYSKKRIIR